MDAVAAPRLIGAPPKTDPNGQDDARLKEVARKLEASFLSEMLKSAGVGATPDQFGGGAGEDQFSSFLRQAQADEMVKSGGIGLAQSLFEALKEQANGGQ
ncbi:rod-binding protein [Aliiroseovarius sp. S2029]|uniref:rod-binding protein n=1 Tax=Aliiroseovarius sp. S2029 TaxID=2936988 RepID=UPI0020C0548A|nr:rod-binding protein [Aliiroseovarius sp. S2029]MCK8484490.1 rod-binding protein [Aliiroseovarius sp. S2029]